MVFFYTVSGLLVILISIILAKMLPLNRIYRLIAVGTVVVSSYIIYMSVGAFPQLYQYQLKEQQKEKVTQILQSMDGKQGLIIKLKERLQVEPSSAEGHYLLAKLLASDGQWKEAVAHFDTAKTIESSNINYQVNYAHALWQMNHNQFNDQIRDSFTLILKQNPNQVDALNMLAMDAYQQNKYNQAILYWRKLLKISPPGSEEAKLIEEAIIKAQKAKGD